MRLQLREIAAAAQHDPKQALMDSLGDMSGIEPFHNLVLVATYIEPEKTAGGVYLSDRSLEEGRFQGKAALVLSMGPLAFKDDEGVRFGGKSVSPGDWVLVRPSDGYELYKTDERHGTSCRLFEDIHIKAKLADPSLVY